MFKPHPEEFFTSDFEAVAAEAGVPVESADFAIVEGDDGHDLVVVTNTAPAPTVADVPTEPVTEVPPTTQE